MKLMNEYDLWEEMQTYLGANEKTDMFVDYEISLSASGNVRAG